MSGAGEYPGAIGPADTAGVPWGGRELTGAGFAGDTGEADPALVSALREADDAGLVAALAGARLLVPLTAVEGAQGPQGDASTDMAVVLLDHPDGRTALPAFTSLAALADLDPAMRPVPVTAERAAEAVIGERADLLVLDCASATAREVRASMVWALAQRRPWVAAHADPFVAAAVARACAGTPEVRDHALAEGDPAGDGVLRVDLTLAPGLDAAQVQTVVTGVGERLATDGELRARVDGLTFRVR